MSTTGTGREPGGEIVIYRSDDGQTHLEARFVDETVWLTQAQIVDLFQTSKANVSEHIKHIFDDGELDPGATVRDFRTVRVEGGREVARNLAYYSLDVILAVGYRVRSRVATQFRTWASDVLKEYLRKGFAMNDALLKQAGGGGYWRELLARIRDIRSSEKVFYRQLLDLYATSVDYDPRADESALYFKIVQNKMHYAAHGHTAAEIVHARADAGQPFMGLTTFEGTRPTKAEVVVAKNYLTQTELEMLNRLVSLFFDQAELHAIRHEPMYMKDWLAELDDFARRFGEGKLAGAGSVSHEQAVAKAEAEYAKYRAAEPAELSPVERDYLNYLRATQKQLEGQGGTAP
ncbi:MAG: virulence RhuM family protein [Propionibacteriaceae bacterium]|jgi:hypothetical protein|nr:virulence RhuM family protein [Propionibacteriaceae bacterium]